MKIKNQNELHDIVHNFLIRLKAYSDRATIVGLLGDLGAGKTTFVQECGKILGVQESITSPTFVIMNMYELQILQMSPFSWKKIIHMDAYRIQEIKELQALHFDELVKTPEALIFIEWPEQIISAIPYFDARVTLQSLHNSLHFEEREILIEYL